MWMNPLQVGARVTENSRGVVGWGSCSCRSEVAREPWVPHAWSSFIEVDWKAPSEHVQLLPEGCMYHVSMTSCKCDPTPNHKLPWNTMRCFVMLSFDCVILECELLESEV